MWCGVVWVRVRVWVEGIGWPGYGVAEVWGGGEGGMV